MIGLLIDTLVNFAARCIVERREFELEIPLIDDRDNEDVDYDGGERWSNSKLCRVNPRCLICCGKIGFIFKTRNNYIFRLSVAMT